MAISSLNQVFNQLKVLQDHPERDLKVSTAKVGNYYGVVSIYDHELGDIEEIGETLEMYAINEMGLVPNGVTQQAKKFGFVIEKTNRQECQFDYVIRCGGFDIFFGS